MPAKKDLPSTLQRSDEHAQDIYSETLASAEDEYGDGRRAHRTAYAALKHAKRTLRAAYEVKIANKLELVGGNRRES